MINFIFRAYFNYGGKDIQELLCYLMCNSSSYSLEDGNGGHLNVSDLIDQNGIRTIKESLCHLDLVNYNIDDNFFFQVLMENCKFFRKILLINYLILL